MFIPDFLLKFIIIGLFFCRQALQEPNRFFSNDGILPFTYHYDFQGKPEPESRAY
jgi:hypothetical protein